MPAMFYLMTSPISLFLRRVSKKYLAPSIYSYPYWRLKSNIRFYKGVFCLFGHPLMTALSSSVAALRSLSSANAVRMASMFPLSFSFRLNAIFLDIYGCRSGQLGI